MDELTVLRGELVVETLMSLVWLELLLLWRWVIWSSSSGSWSAWAVVDWIGDWLLVDSTCFQELSDQLLLALIQVFHLFSSILVQTRGDVQRSLLKRLRIYVDLLLVDEVLDRLDILPKACGVQRIIKSVGMINCCALVDEVLDDLKMPISGREHHWRPISVTLRIQQPSYLCFRFVCVKCIIIFRCLFIFRDDFLDCFEVSSFASLEQKLDLLLLVVL